MHWRRSAVGLLALGICMACAGEELEPFEGDEASDVRVTVADVATSGCSTRGVTGLATQIADEMRCMFPEALDRIGASETIRFVGPNVVPYFAVDAAASIRALSESYTIEIRSAFRTVAEQYVVYQWKTDGRCNTTKAALPGNSFHESGRAIDIQNYDELKEIFEADGWEHEGPSDPVHFEHLYSPDLRGTDILAFQRLWNRANPYDLIAETGDYDEATARKLARSPVGGFSIEEACEYQ